MGFVTCRHIPMVLQYWSVWPHPSTTSSLYCLSRQHPKAYCFMPDICFSGWPIHRCLMMKNTLHWSHRKMEQSYEATIPWGNNIKRALKRRPCKTDWSLTMAVMHTAGSTEDTKSCMHHNIVTTLPAWRLLLHSKQPSHKLKVTQLLLVFC